MDRRRILILFAAAWVSAGLLTWFLFAKVAAPKKEQRTPIMAAARDLPVGTLLRKSDLKRVNVLAADFPRGGLVSDKDALNRVVLYPVSTNEPLVTSKLSQLAGAEGIPATIEPGYRAVSVQITDVSGVAGLVIPGAHVDVLFTRTGNLSEAITSTILQNVRVLAIGHAVQVGQALDPKAPKVPVATLVVTPEDAQKLELGKNEGKISLSLRNPLDLSSNVGGDPVRGEALDPDMNARLLARSKKNIRVPDMNNPRVFNEVSGAPLRIAPKKETLPAPRVVVDVFRGDKHVQEAFRD